MQKTLSALLILCLILAAVAVRAVPVLMAEECTADNVQACE